MYGRYSLSDLDLTGRRKVIRDRVRLITVALLALLIVGFAFERHSTESWGGTLRPTHRFFDDTGPWPFAALGFALFLQWIAHRTRMVVGILVAVGTLGATFASVVAMALVHLLSKVDRNSFGETVVPIAAVGLFVMCVVQIVVEPWLAGVERRALESPMPAIPSAVVVRSSR